MASKMVPGTSTDASMTPTSPEDRLAALELCVGQLLGILPYQDAALTEASVVGNLARQIEISLKSIQQ